jgi:hypothetical protein
MSVYFRSCSFDHALENGAIFTDAPGEGIPCFESGPQPANRHAGSNCRRAQGFFKACGNAPLDLRR